MSPAFEDICPWKILGRAIRLSRTVKAGDKMHELSVTQALLQVCLQHAEAAGAARVTGIYVEIGQLSSYVDDSVQFYWDLISAGTPAEGAQLHFERTKMQLECANCQKSFSPQALSFECPECGSQMVSVAAGDVFQLVGIDIEKEPQASGVEAV